MVRHSLINFYVLSVFTLIIVFFIAVTSVNNPKLSIFQGDVNSFTNAFSTNLDLSLGQKVFGSIKNMMMIITAIGILLQVGVLYALFQKNVKKNLKKYYLVYWGNLFLPYLLVLLFSLKF